MENLGFGKHFELFSHEAVNHHHLLICYESLKAFLFLFFFDPK